MSKLDDPKFLVDLHDNISELRMEVVRRHSRASEKCEHHHFDPAEPLRFAKRCHFHGEGNRTLPCDVITCPLRGRPKAIW